jgi:hypothetical protein
MPLRYRGKGIEGRIEVRAGYQDGDLICGNSS